MIKTYLGGLQLPVNPLEELVFSMSANNQQFEIVAIGEVSKIGSRTLIKVDIKSLFTNGDYPFVVNGRLSSEQYKNKVKAMFDAEKPVRFICTGDGVDINIRCSMEDFKYTKPFGEWEDYYYTINLMEYRAHSATRLVIQPTVGDQQQATEQPTRPEEAQTPTTHTVVAGDCLWNLAAKYYGDGSRYMDIWNANQNLGNPTPDDLYVGQTVVIP